MSIWTLWGVVYVIEYGVMEGVGSEWGVVYVIEFGVMEGVGSEWGVGLAVCGCDPRLWSFRGVGIIMGIVIDGKCDGVWVM